MTRRLCRCDSSAAILALALALTASASAWGNPRVETRSGPVVGAALPDASVVAFLGIPYAEAPVGALRFRPPRARRPWREPLLATAFGPPAPQNPDPVLVPREDLGADRANEDCLTLNVWTPGVDEERRPVMVWIHPGANLVGSSRVSTFDGRNLAAAGDVVVVSLNYRLGIFGFVDVSVLGGGAYRGSANHGLHDQLLALQWVRANAERFGGDPANVTIFGASAGGFDISALLAMDRPSRFFRRAILQSGAALVRSAEMARAQARALFERGGIETLDELRALSTAEILELERRALAHLPTTVAHQHFLPVVDGELVRDSPVVAVAAGNARDISLVVGTTDDETRFWALYDEELRRQRPSRMPLLRTRISGFQRFALVSAYRMRRLAWSRGELSMAILSDVAFRIPSIRLAEAQARAGGVARMYLFTWDVPRSDNGAMHTAELPFVFGTFDTPGGRLTLGAAASPEERARWDRLGDAVRSYWLAFAQTGDGSPTAVASLPAWPPYELGRRRTLLLDDALRVRSDPRSVERGLYAKESYRALDEELVALSEAAR